MSDVTVRFFDFAILCGYSSADERFSKTTLRVSEKGIIYFYDRGGKVSLDPRDRNTLCDEAKGIIDFHYDVKD